MVEFSTDDAKVTVKGSRYRAEPGEPGKCTVCAFKRGFGCTLTETILRDDPTGFNKLGLPRCQPGYRKDGKGIIWVLDV